MKKQKQYNQITQPPSPQQRKRATIFRFATASFLSLLLLFVLYTTTITSPILTPILSSLYLPIPKSVTATITRSLFVESKLHVLPVLPSSQPPRLAYLISGSAGDGAAIKRTLLALYHPRNRYVVHLDRESREEERVELKGYVEGHALFRRFGNVRVLVRANLVTYRGPTMVANTLHGAAVALRGWRDWDWFINLSALDYPLVTQDDLLHVFSNLPRDLNFIDYTSDLGWKNHLRAKPVMVDPGLYMTKKQDVFMITQRRSKPTAFKLFTGSAWMALSRSFIDYIIWGWDNLPRTVLMYYTNFVSSPEGYFHTVICNVEEFKNTTVNTDLHFISWDNPPKQHPHYLTFADMQKMVDSNAAFGRKFRREDPVLDEIDRELLSRGAGMAVPGGWCIGSRDNGTDPCSVIGNTTFLRPGPGSKRIQTLISTLLSDQNFRSKQCV